MTEIIRSSAALSGLPPEAPGDVPELPDFDGPHDPYPNRRDRIACGCTQCCRATEPWWLIERNDGDVPRWGRFERSGWVWVSDAIAATRYASRDDALRDMRMLQLSVTTLLRVAEHDSALG